MEQNVLSQERRNELTDIITKVLMEKMEDPVIRTMIGRVFLKKRFQEINNLNY